MARPPDTVIVLWRSLGPYHVARAVAAERILAERSLRLLTVELSDRDGSYPWTIDRSTLPIEIRTIAPGVMLGPSRPRLVDRLRALLDDVAPVAIAVAGYDRAEMRNALRWARKRGIAAVLMLETKWDDSRRSWPRFGIVRRFARLAGAALASGAPAGEFAVALGIPRERVFRQYGAVDNEFFERASACTGGRDGPPYFIASCRLIEERKNVKGLLRAYARYREGARENPWPLIICGDGPDGDVIRGFARASGVEDVRFEGFLDAADLAERYARAGCLVHPAKHEAWGLVVNEAMAAGLPVLVSRRAGCAYDLVHEGVNGYTFDPADEEALAKLMDAIASSSDAERLRMGEASRAIVQRFGPDRFGEGLLTAIRAAGWREAVA